MIHTIYHHGDDRPATDLTPAQLKAALADSAGRLWVDLASASNEEAEQILAGVFGFHPLTIDDCLNEEQRPKVEDFGEYVFIVARYATAEALRRGGGDITEVDMYIGPNYLVTFHAAPVDPLDPVRAAAATDVRLLDGGVDRLAAHCLDQIADGLVDVLDSIDEDLEAIEENLFDRPEPTLVSRIFDVRHQLVALRRTIGPQREVMNRLAWDTFRPIRPETRLYFREVYDRLVLALDLVDSRRDLAGGALEAYLSVSSNRLGETMRVLTALQVVLLPMTLIASIYGMNFPDLPPFRTPNGWVFAVAAMVVVAAGMAVLFRARRWL